MLHKLLLFCVLLSIGACSLKPNPQVSCNFIQNSDQQRVSWKRNTPVVITIDSSVPDVYYNSAINAANVWNNAIGHEVIKIGDKANIGPNGGLDNINLLYFLPNWDSASNQQAETMVYWTGAQIIEADIKVNIRNFQFSYDDIGEPNEVDMESLLIHEFGHVLGLKHISDSSSVMFPYLSNDSLRRNLSQEDINSIICEY
jgi:Matrixin